MILLKLFYTFFKIGLFTFGGGYAMIPLIEHEVVPKGWISDSSLVDFIAISESTPGPFAVNISTYIGTETKGLLGAFFATLGVVLPSFIIILIIAKFVAKFKENKIINGCMMGLRPAVVGLIATAVISIGKTVFMPNGTNLSSASIYLTVCSALIFLLMLFLGFKKIHPIFIILLSAFIGILTGYLPQIVKAF